MQDLLSLESKRLQSLKTWSESVSSREIFPDKISCSRIERKSPNPSDLNLHINVQVC